MGSFYYPARTTMHIRMEKLFRYDENRKLSECMSSRMVRSAAVLSEGEFLGWQMIVPVKGLVRISLFGTRSIEKTGLEWISEKTGSTSRDQVPKKINQVI